jgi:hypothetical protein
MVMMEMVSLRLQAELTMPRGQGHQNKPKQTPSTANNSGGRTSPRLFIYRILRHLLGSNQLSFSRSRQTKV